MQGAGKYIRRPQSDFLRDSMHARLRPRPWRGFLREPLHPTHSRHMLLSALMMERSQHHAEIMVSAQQGLQTLDLLIGADLRTNGIALQYEVAECRI